ncbi:hypothetical protein MHK_002789 [Candidatus Magnetomorum sp. HK-1]|nr:hypothetical protein MHK_002789 [Candidatus Magnetomorum sp. HK-1]
MQTNQISNKQQTNVIQIHDGNKYAIPVEGSLGLLALGASGLIQWRQTRDQQNKQLEVQQNVS